jgi:uncharacterized peroxidase-related enzyme
MKRLFPSLPQTAMLGDVFQAFPGKLPPLLNYLDQVMRSDSPLSAAQRELIAAYVSGLNACVFCHGAHTVHARAFGIEPDVIDALMKDPETAPVETELKPVLAYVAKLTLTPTQLVEADANAVYAAGWSEEALFDAIQTAALFCMMNRILEGTGVTEYHSDPRGIERSALEPLRSPSAYSDFGHRLGIMP